MSPRRVLVLLASVLLLVLVTRPAPLAAQAQPNCVGGCNNYNVSVTPDYGTAPSRPANSSGYTASFMVQNTGALSDTYYLTCIGRTGVTCTSVSSNNFTLASGAKKFITAHYDVGSQGTGKLVLTAAGEMSSDSGWYTVPITAPEGSPGVALVNFNRDNHDRSLCLTAGAGEAAAYQCGYLPSTIRCRGIDQGAGTSLSLVHTSAQAYPDPIVAAAVTEPESIARPDNIFCKFDQRHRPGYRECRHLGRRTRRYDAAAHRVP